MYISFSFPLNIQDEQKLYVWGRQDGELGKWTKSEEFYMQKGDKDRRKTPVSSLYNFGFALFFQIIEFLPGNLPLFSQISPKEFRNSRLFCMHLVNCNSCSSVFSARQSERVSTGNCHVIIFNIRPGQIDPAETQHCAETPRTTQCIGQGCTSVRLMLHTLHEHPAFHPKQYGPIQNIQDL